MSAVERLAAVLAMNPDDTARLLAQSGDRTLAQDLADGEALRRRTGVVEQTLKRLVEFVGSADPSILDAFSIMFPNDASLFHPEPTPPTPVLTAARCGYLIRMLGLTPFICNRAEDDALHRSRTHPDAHAFLATPDPEATDG